MFQNGRVLYPLLGLVAYLPLWLLAPYRPVIAPFLLLLPAPFGFLWLGRRAAARGKLGIGWLLTTSLLLRLLFMVQSPSLSEDLYRYFWDGSLVSRGESPYLLAPQQMVPGPGPQTEVYTRMAHRDRRSVYPPVAQMWFGLGWKLWGPNPVGWKLMLLMAEAALFWFYLRGFQTPPERLALWALHPLPILEFYSSAHIDVVALALLVGGLYCVTRGRPARAGGLLAAATLVKLIPVFTLPLSMSCLGRRKGARLAIAFAAGTALLTVPFFWLLGPGLESASALIDSLLGFNRDWRFNSLPFFLLKRARRLAGIVASLTLGALCLLMTRGQDGGDGEDLKTRLYFLVALFLALSHTVHPWYVAWLLIFHPLLGTRYWAGLYLSAAVMVSYMAYGLNPPGERLWLLWMEWLPYYFLLGRDAAAYHKALHDRKASLRQDSLGR